MYLHCGISVVLIGWREGVVVGRGFRFTLGFQLKLLLGGEGGCWKGGFRFTLCDSG